MQKEILIVEDANLVALHLKKLLQSKGYKVIGSLAYAEKAIEFVNKRRPDLILMDVMLKGELDGIDAALTIGKAHNIPILFLTALSDEETINRIKSTNNPSLNKPFQELELHEKIAGILAATN